MIALQWDTENLAADVSVNAMGIAQDTTLSTATIISLFTDRRASLSDALPTPDADRRGWVGDALDDDGDQWGSRLWLLRRAKQTEETRRRADEYAREALAWMVGTVAKSVDVEATWLRPGVLALAIGITLLSGAAERYSFMLTVADNAI